MAPGRSCASAQAATADLRPLSGRPGWLVAVGAEGGLLRTRIQRPALQRRSLLLACRSLKALSALWISRPRPHNSRVVAGRFPSPDRRKGQRMLKCKDCGYELTLLERLTHWLFGRATHLCDHEHDSGRVPASS